MVATVQAVRESLEDLFMRAVRDPTTGLFFKPGAAGGPKGGGAVAGGALAGGAVAGGAVAGGGSPSAGASLANGTSPSAGGPERAP
jgi:hypothetical protein